MATLVACGLPPLLGLSLANHDRILAISVVPVLTMVSALSHPIRGDLRVSAQPFDQGSRPCDPRAAGLNDVHNKGWKSMIRSAAVLGLVLCLTGGLTGGVAAARTLDGVTMPDSMVVEGQTLHLNGMAVRTVTILHLHVYVAGLYVAKPTQDAQAILQASGLKVLRIQFVRSAGVDRVQTEMRRGQARDCTDGCSKADDAAFAQLLATARAFNQGDIQTYIYAPDALRILFDGKPTATIVNADFSRRMLDSWIGAHPPSAAMRDGLLGVTAG